MIVRSNNRYRGNHAALSGQINRKASAAKIDERMQLANLELEPLAGFDPIMERFFCRRCPYKAERFIGIKAHLITEHLDM